MANFVLRGLFNAGRKVGLRSGSVVESLGAVNVSRNVLLEQRRYKPVCTVDTNAEPEKIDPNFLTEMSTLIAETLNKPEKLISVALRTDVQLCRDGNQRPNAVVHIWSIGVFDEERNPAYSKIFIDFMSAKLGVSTDRIALFFHPVTKTDAAHLLYMDQ